jgi:hypothetical protein
VTAPRAWVVWIPGRHAGLNELLYERAQRMKKSKDAAGASLIIRSAKVPQLQRVRLHYHCVEPNKRRDPGNFCGGAEKLGGDALQLAGVIANDGWRNVAAISFTWACDPARPGIRITITEDKEQL